MDLGVDSGNIILECTLLTTAPPHQQWLIFIDHLLDISLLNI